jgi:CRP/FNR family transcriptional regulator, cyclic AMP receptor protein
MKVQGLFRNAQRTVDVPRGTVVFEQGAPGEEMYGVISGSIELHNTNRVVATLGVDEVFGEMALVDKSPRSATAVAAEDSVLAVIDRQKFLFLIAETPMFALNVMSTMAERFREQG